MKTIICDVCGKTKNKVLIFRFKREGLWGSIWNNDLNNFDICKDCLDKVKQLRDKENGGDE